MSRCPNCGSAVRIGAKFCTSCGFRLANEEPVAAPGRSPFATTSSSTWSATPVAEDVAVGDARPVAAAAEPEPSWSAAGSTVEEPPADDTVVAVSPAGDADVIEMVPAEVDGNDQPGGSWFMPTSDEMNGERGEVATDGSGLAPSDESLHNDAADAAPNDEPALEDTAPSTPENGEVIFVSSVGSTAAGSDGSPSTNHSTAATSPPAEAPPTSNGRSADALAEARSLAARLAEVLGRVSGIDSSGRQAAVPDNLADERDVEALRSVAEAAQARPRDVDVMLDLVLRADTIAAVIADRAALVAALGGGGSTGGEELADEDAQASDEGWSPDDEQPSTYPAWGAS